MKLKYDHDKLDIHVTKVIDITYSNGAYDLGTIYTDENDKVIRVEYRDADGRYQTETDSYISVEEYTNILKDEFMARMQLKFDRLIKENQALQSMLKDFGEDFEDETVS